MQVKLSNALFVLASVLSLIVGAQIVMDWEKVSDSRNVSQEVLPLFEGHLPLVLGLYLLFLVAYLLSFETRRPKRPYLLITIAIATFAFPVGALVREAFVAYELMISGRPAMDLTFLALVVAAVLTVFLLMIAFEAINRGLWSTLAAMFDRREQSGAAMFCSRLALLFHPGQKTMLRSVALSRFHSGNRTDAVVTLKGLHEQGQSDPDILEALCKDANERNEREDYRRYLSELYGLLPDEQELRDALFDELFAQRKAAEALTLLDKSANLPRSEEILEKQCRLLLTEGRPEQAATVAGELSSKEGIPFRRSQKLLRDVLTAEESSVTALNLLAMQAERMALREQKVRWLEKSYAADSRQKEVRNELIRLYRESGQQLPLEPLLRDHLRENPRDREAQIELAQVLHLNEKSNEALEILTPLSKRRDGNALSYFTEAQIHFDLRNYEESKTAVLLAKESRPDDDLAKKIQALAIRIERAVLTAEVAQALEQAHENPDNLAFQLEALDRLVSGGHAEKVVRLADDVLSRHPNARPQLMARLSVVAEKPDAAFAILNLYSDLLAADGNYEDALRIIEVMATRSIDKVATLKEGSQKILRRSPHHLPTLRRLGAMYHEAGKYTDMIHSYALYLAHGGEETEQIDRALAQAYISLFDYENARRFVNQLLEIDPKDTALLRQVIPLALTTGAVEDAADYLKRLEIADPRDPALKTLKEQVHTGLGERRFEFLKREFESGKGNAETLEQLGDVARQMENYNDAITYFQRAARDPDDPVRARRCTAKLALAYMKKRLEDLAAETLREVTISLDDDPKELAIIMDILYEIGTLFLEMKHYSKAENIFKQLCKIDAGYRDVLNKVESLRG